MDLEAEIALGMRQARPESFEGAERLDQLPPCWTGHQLDGYVARPWTGDAQVGTWRRATLDEVRAWPQVGGARERTGEQEQEDRR